MKKWVVLFCILFVLAGFAMVYDSRTPSVYIAPQKEIVNKEVSQPSTPILFVGDIMLGRYVELLTNTSGDELYSFRNVEDYLKQHVTIANLEGPIPDSHTPTPANGFTFSFPSSTPRILKEGGIAAVSLANNHMFDKGSNGYSQTKRALDTGGVPHFGGYTPTESNYFETKLGEKQVIVYGVTMIATGWDEAQALEVTKNLRVSHPQAHLIAFLHWGNEYVTQNTYQRAFAHSLIDNGVDTVIGGHPHVVQGVELYNNKPIFYSLGNFIFDQWWRNDLEDGVMIRLSEDKNNYVYEIIPIRQAKAVPSIATSTVRDNILSNMSKQSDVSLKEAILRGSFSIPK